MSDSYDWGDKIFSYAPPSLNEVGFYDTPGVAFDVVVAGLYAYVADEYGGLIILNYTGLKYERLFLPLMVRK